MARPKPSSVHPSGSPGLFAVTPDFPDRFFAGTSGWAYSSWKPGFYPDGTSPSRFLISYALRLNSVEVNYTTRKPLTSVLLSRWMDQVTPGFRFSFKAPQRITHFRRLLGCEALVTEFFSELVAAVEAGVMGVVLFQLPPNFKADLPRLADFLDLPAFRARLAPPVAFEFRHDSWRNDRTYELLAARNVSVCLTDSAESGDAVLTPALATATSHLYVRLRRPGGYAPRALASLATELRTLAAGRDLYAYLMHEEAPSGALCAQALLRRAGGRTRTTPRGPAA